jgi:hypothetical protein
MPMKFTTLVGARLEDDRRGACRDFPFQSSVYYKSLRVTTGATDGAYFSFGRPNVIA